MDAVKQKTTEERASRCAAWPSRADVVDLITENNAVLRLAGRLDGLVGNLHVRGRAMEAGKLSSRLNNRLESHFGKEAAVLEVFSSMDSTAIREAIERTRAEHEAMRWLRIPVARGLCTVGRGELPSRPTRFVLATNIFCEFTRMHTAYKRTTLYPLLGRLTVATAEAPVAGERISQTDR